MGPVSSGEKDRPPDAVDTVGIGGTVGPGTRVRGVSPRAGLTWVRGAWGWAEAREPAAGTRRSARRRGQERHLRVGLRAGGCTTAPSSGVLVLSLKPKPQSFRTLQAFG